MLGKLETQLTFDFGSPGLVLVDVGGANGRRLSELSGDAQGTSNIEGPKAARIYNLFYQFRVGPPRPTDSRPAGTLVRAGVLDLNAHFYVQGDAAANFLNGSHGIGPEMSHSGRNGPSVYPNSGLALMVEHSVKTDMTIRAGVFDGVPNDPDSPDRTSLRLSKKEGALLVAELGVERLTLGGWGYTSPQAKLDGSGLAKFNAGGYANLNGDISRGVQAWVTVGKSSARFNDVHGYVGLGVLGRLTPDAALGLAIASAHVTGIGRETTVEVTAPINIGRAFLLQPDFQYVRHPSGAPGSARVFGVRISYKFESSTAEPGRRAKHDGPVLRRQPAGSVLTSDVSIPQ